MDRRQFLGAGAVSALAAVEHASPLNLKTTPRPAPPNDLPVYVATIDAGVDRISRWSPTAAFPKFQGNREETDSLARAMLTSLYVTAMVSDLPTSMQVQPIVQERILGVAPTLGDALDRTTTFLRGHTDAELARLQKGLRQHDIAKLIFAPLDSAAGTTGISDYRRAHINALYGEVGWRLRNQPPGLVVSEYLEKVERVQESDPQIVARERDLAARVGEMAFWQATGKSVRDQRIMRGLKVMGFGVLTFAGGAAIVSAGSEVGLFIGTVGAIMFLVGLVMLLVGLATSSSKRS